ncbi:hypothetical protein AAEO56_10660 [Flavobacterium sp. DGU11]|uniref:DUF4199 domain-containing protein n=1 Tax=Flavobacterium arundinis TaxID=3139143 RepID=A0ABU9HX42_9FLAO
MKISRVLINGLIIFACIAAFFLLMEVAGLKDQVYLRLVNFIFVIYGINRTIRGNFKDHIDGYFANLIAGILTAMVSLIVGIFSFMAYVEYRGGADYLHTFAKSYIFGGGEPSINDFCIALAVEGTAASVIVSFTLMQFWKDKVEKINKVDDVNHIHN